MRRIEAVRKARFGPHLFDQCRRHSSSPDLLRLLTPHLWDISSPLGGLSDVEMMFVVTDRCKLSIALQGAGDAEHRSTP